MTVLLIWSLPLEQKSKHSKIKGKYTKRRDKRLSKWNTLFNKTLYMFVLVCLPVDGYILNGKNNFYCLDLKCPR